MDRSITLLNKALERTSSGELADAIGVRQTALSNSKKIGQLSPVLAGNIAAFLNENIEHWMAVAAAESAREGKAKTLLLKNLSAHVKRLVYRRCRGLKQWAKNWAGSPFFTPGNAKTVYCKVNC